MKFSAAVVLAAAIGASAHPGHHAHRHAHRSAVQGREFVMAKKPAPPAPSTTTTPPPPPPATSTPAPAPAVANAAAAVDSSSSSSSSTSASASSSAGTGAFKPFCGGNKKRATLAQIAYAGNVGGPDDLYGCNIMEISGNAVSHYDYTMTFNNNLGSDQKCCCWNKIAKDGTISGFWLQNVAMKFDLPAHGNAYVAFEANSQVGCACNPGSIPTTSFGQVASTWVEADFENASNQQCSGADASALVSANNGLNIPPLKVCGLGICSTIFEGGAGDNAYVKGTDDLDGIGINAPKGKLALEVTVG